MIAAYGRPYKEVLTANMFCYETEHYQFHYHPGGKAEADIETIAATQEAAYKHITTILDLSMREKIQYYFYDSREEVGRECERRFGEYTPYNGCTVSKNEILAVYNEKIRCIGIHEDTHLLMFTLGFSASGFLEEGIACAMDSLWWGIDNTAWVAYYRQEGRSLSVKDLILLPRENFYIIDDRITYPLAGSFVNYLLLRFGKDKFHSFYLSERDGSVDSTVLGYSLSELEDDFFQYIDLLSYDKAVFDRIAASIEESE